MTLRVMIVEDELILALDLEDVLQEAGYQVVGVAACMHQALALAEKVKPDIALMDVHLARGTNGIETARLLREKFDVPSLFISGNLDETTRSIAVQCAPIGFIPKPASPDMVLKVISAVA